MKLSTWAKKKGITYQTAWAWVKKGHLDDVVEYSETGSIFINEKENVNKNIQETTFIYGRVSSHSKKSDLESQIRLCEQFCVSNGWVVDRCFKEIASGMNDNRTMLNKILENPPTRLVILHKDRLTRFGFNYIFKLLGKLGCEIIIINKENCDRDDLLKDFIAIITSFCCRLYGARRGQAKALGIKNTIQ